MSEQKPESLSEFSHAAYKTQLDAGTAILEAIDNVVEKHWDLNINDQGYPKTGMHLDPYFGRARHEMDKNSISLYTPRPEDAKKLVEYMQSAGYQVYSGEYNANLHMVRIEDAISPKFVEDLDRGLALMKETQASRVQTAAAAR